METRLLYHSPLWLSSNMARYSHDNHHLSDTRDITTCVECGSKEIVSFNTSCTNCGSTDTEVNTVIGPKDIDLIYRIGIKKNHNTILRPITYDFHVEFSTKNLLAFSKHTIGIDFVMTSSRYTTVKKLKNERSFIIKDGSKIIDTHIPNEGWYRSRQFIEHTNIPEIDQSNILQLEAVRKAVVKGYSNDEISTMLPQAWLYKGQIHINAVALRHLFSLRNEKSHAHIWMQEFVRDLYNQIPKDHKFLYEDIMDIT